MMTVAPTTRRPYVVTNATRVLAALVHCCSKAISYARSCYCSGRNARGLVPVAFDVDPAARTLFPAARHPLGARPRPLDIVAVDPHVLMAVPAPVAGLPTLDLDALARQDRHHLDPRRRRRHRHINLGLQLR